MRAPQGTRRARKLARAGGWVEEMEGGVNGQWVGAAGEQRAREEPKRAAHYDLSPDLRREMPSPSHRPRIRVYGGVGYHRFAIWRLSRAPIPLEDSTMVYNTYA